MARPARFPDRPVLHPGVLVTRRDDAHLQIGLDPALAVVTPDVPETRALLSSLAEGDAPRLTPAVAASVGRASRRGLVIDGDDLFADLPASRLGSHSVAAAYAHAGLGGRELLSPPLDSSGCRGGVRSVAGDR